MSVKCASVGTRQGIEGTSWKILSRSKIGQIVGKKEKKQELGKWRSTRRLRILETQQRKMFKRCLANKEDPDAKIF